MKKGIIIKLSLVLYILLTLIFILTKAYIEPSVAKKIKSELKNGHDLIIDVKDVNVNIFGSEVTLNHILITSFPKQEGYSGEIGSVKFEGIGIIKAVLKREIFIDEVTIYKSSFKGKIPLSGRDYSPVLAPLRIGIGKIVFDHFDLEIENDSSGQKYSVKKGLLRINGLQVSKLDTVTPGIVTFFDFEAGEINIESPDKMYTYLVSGINYSSTINSLIIDSLLIIPKYEDYDFTSRFKFQKNRIEATLSKINVHNFFINSSLKPMNLASSYVEIGEMDMKVFRDKRKELLHKKRPLLQDWIDDIPLVVRIDSTILIKGQITYKVHAEDSKEPGFVFFNDLNVRFLNLTNDTLYKTKNEIMELKADASLMGKGRLSILLKAEIFDKTNTFSVKGSLSGMDINELNPILEKNAFIFASGNIDGLNFSFVADKIRAKGKLTIFYKGLDITVKDKRSDDTTSLRARIFSYVANRKILDSNPLKGEETRVGIIDYERDPEKFIFHYCFRSVLTGISSSLLKNEKISKRILQD